MTAQLSSDDDDLRARQRRAFRIKAMFRGGVPRARIGTLFGLSRQRILDIAQEPMPGILPRGRPRGSLCHCSLCGEIGHNARGHRRAMIAACVERK